MEKKKSHQRMVRELDQMPKDVTSEEADFLEEVIDTFGDGKKLKPKIAQRLEEMYGKYLGVKDPDAVADDNENLEKEEDLEEDLE
jgi:hypothetical protein